MPAELENSKILQIPPRPAGKLPQKISRKQNSLNKKLLAIADDAKPTHKLAKIGFLLSLGGILTSLISVLLSSAAPLLLGVILIIAGLITSIKGLAKIKQAPNEYGGKGFAITGILLSGLILLTSIAFILYVLSFAGAFV
ncbi:hypothetical protein AAE02nite_17070 [Adhaeribacter aerolatus]|uniref:DUF4190 domain-containing protein n=2 Tax=Adhaeribacter aerolatus TaxID=670289 RepID=A0A512AWF2_9BACT|nr:hypothetical protein AAE02nite_17070 [Adhaeribacter aerolatus]